MPWFKMKMLPNQKEICSEMLYCIPLILLPGPMNGLWAFIARTVGINWPRGWGIVKPAVCSGLQAHIVNFRRWRRLSRKLRTVFRVAATWYLLTLSWHFSDTFFLPLETLLVCLSVHSKREKMMGWYFDTLFKKNFFPVSNLVLRFTFAPLEIFVLKNSMNRFFRSRRASHSCQPIRIHFQAAPAWIRHLSCKCKDNTLFWKIQIVDASI